ncbi:MAG: alpha/beta hydrolase family protein [Solirubrobacteraceae bacterium]
MAVRDLEALLDELADLAAAGAQPGTHVYGSDPEQVADLLMPPADGAHPVAVLLHGGFWRARFTKSLMAALAADLAARGWATWNVEYRRAGNGGGVPETLDDVRAALAALHRVPAPLDLARVVVIGHSAGGQLGLCVADEPVVKAVVSLAGVCDLAAAFADGIGQSAVRDFIGAGPQERPDAYRLADPLARIPAGVPVLLIHGDADQRVPVRYSRRYVEAAGDARCELLELAGVDHFALIDPRTSAWAQTAARLETMR